MIWVITAMLVYHDVDKPKMTDYMIKSFDTKFIDSVPKGGMVSPQVQELYMLVEYLGENVDKLKEQMEAEIPMILKNDMVIQFHEERLIDLEERKNGNH
jgi:hypothetical protein